MISSIQKTKDELIKQLQELHGARLIEFKVNPNGSINVVTDKGEFFISKPGRYT